MPALRSETIDALRAAGVVGAERDADDLLAAATTADELAVMVARRLRGEPTPWIVGSTRFLGHDIEIRTGVYVPRWHTEHVARHAARHLPADGIAVDVCTGSGAVGAFLARVRPGSRVVGTDVD